MRFLGVFGVSPKSSMILDFSKNPLMSTVLVPDACSGTGWELVLVPEPSSRELEQFHIPSHMAVPTNPSPSSLVPRVGYPGNWELEDPASKKRDQNVPHD